MIYTASPGHAIMMVKAPVKALLVKLWVVDEQYDIETIFLKICKRHERGQDGPVLSASKVRAEIRLEK